MVAQFLNAMTFQLDRSVFRWANFCPLPWQASLLIALSGLLLSPMDRAVAQHTPVDGWDQTNDPSLQTDNLTLPLPPLEPASDATGYVFGAGDQIAIEVFDYEEFTGSWVVLPDGTITLPVLGAIAVAGETPQSLTTLLTQRLNNFLIDPVVTVSPIVLRPVVVTVAGEVYRPGPVQLRSLSEVTVNRLTDTANSSARSRAESSLDAIPTVSSALVEAGGITRNANIQQIVVRRSQPGGQSSTTTINLWNALWSDQLPEDIILQDGDAIFVPRLEADATVDRRLLGRSSLSPDTIPVRVFGQVEEPGEVAVSPDTSLVGAIAAAGGPTSDARLKRVELVRMSDTGQVENQTIDLSSLTDDYQIQAGDVIFVPESRTSVALNAAGRVLSPLLSVFTGINILNRIFDD